MTALSTSQINSRSNCPLNINVMFVRKFLRQKSKSCKSKACSLIYICEDCNQVWTDEKPFEDHTQKTHEIHGCVQCNGKLEGKNNLDAHFRAKQRAF